MPCLSCYDPHKPVFARGLCSACYSRLRRSGTVERVNAVNQGQICSVDGCDKKAWAKGLCSQHYAQADHPLKAIWRLLRSRVGVGFYPETWDSFDAFLADVGERPSLRHQLRRINTRIPYSKDNCRWLEPVSAHEKRGWSKENQAKYMRDWALKRRFNLDPHEYEEMEAEQNFVCAICEQPEVQVNSKSGVVQKLSVDHCHRSGDVRGLLCFRCNSLLGAVDDDVRIFERATAYLKQRTKAPPE